MRIDKEVEPQMAGATNQQRDDLLTPPVWTAADFGIRGCSGDMSCQGDDVVAMFGRGGKR